MDLRTLKKELLTMETLLELVGSNETAKNLYDSMKDTETEEFILDTFNYYTKIINGLIELSCLTENFNPKSELSKTFATFLLMFMHNYDSVQIFTHIINGIGLVVAGHLSVDEYLKTIKLDLEDLKTNMGDFMVRIAHNLPKTTVYTEGPSTIQ